MVKKLAAAMLVLALGGCANVPDPNTPAGQRQITAEAKTTAAEEAKRGEPCEAAKLEPEEARFRTECTAEKDHKALTKEVEREEELAREGERLKAEGKVP